MRSVAPPRSLQRRRHPLQGRERSHGRSGAPTSPRGSSPPVCCSRREAPTPPRERCSCSRNDARAKTRRMEKSKFRAFQVGENRGFFRRSVADSVRVLLQLSLQSHSLRSQTPSETPRNPGREKSGLFPQLIDNDASLVYELTITSVFFFPPSHEYKFDSVPAGSAESLAHRSFTEKSTELVSSMPLKINEDRAVAEWSSQYEEGLELEGDVKFSLQCSGAIRDQSFFVWINTQWGSQRFITQVRHTERYVASRSRNGFFWNGSHPTPFFPLPSLAR